MEQVRFSRYLAVFAGVMIAITLVFIAIGTLLAPELGGTGTSTIELMVASIVAGQLFVKDHGRAPTKEERRKLVWWSFGLTILFAISMLGILGFIGVYMTSAEDVTQMIAGLYAKLPFGLWLVVTAVALVLSWLPIWLGYAFVGRRFAYLQKKRAQA